MDNTTICVRCKHYQFREFFTQQHTCQSKEAVDPVTGDKWGDTMWGINCHRINHGNCPYYEEKG